MTTVLDKVIGVVKLKDHMQEALASAKRICANDPRIALTDSQIEQAANAVKNKVSFNNTTGALKLGAEIIAKPAKGEAFTPYDNLNEIIEWEFAYEILAQATRTRNLS